jgi:tetratricopeptide (TPR) repeat protein
MSVSPPDFAANFLQAAPTAKSDFRTRLALGLTMLAIGDRFAADALGHLREAVSLAAAGDAGDKRFAASRLTLCVLLARSQTVLQIRGTSNDAQRQILIAALDAGQEILSELEGKYGFKQDDLLDELGDRELCRLGVAALAINKYQTAAKHFGDVIGRNPLYEEAYIQRAQARGFLQDFQGAVDYAAAALNLIDRHKERGEPDESERNLGIVLWTPAILHRKKVEALTVRAKANHQLRRYDAVFTDAKLITELLPESTDGYVLAGNACLASGQLESARSFFQQGLGKETDPGGREKFLEVIKNLE